MLRLQVVGSLELSRVPLKSRRKRRQEVPKPTLDADMQDIELVFEQQMVEDGDPYVSYHSTARLFFFISRLI